MAKQWNLYREDGTVIPAEMERWRWEAHYTDGTVLKQFDDNGHYHQFKEIDQSRLKVFGMVHDELPPVILYWREGIKLIHYYTNYVLRFGKPDEQRLRLYCFGYEGKNEKLILVIMPNDAVVATDDPNRIKIEE